MSQQDDTSHLRDRVEKLHETFSEIKALMVAGFAEIKTGCQHCGKRMGSLEETIYGNGNEGLKIRVDRLEQDQQKQQVAAGQRRAVLIAIAGGVSAVVAAVIQAASKFLLG